MASMSRSQTISKLIAKTTNPFPTIVPNTSTAVYHAREPCYSDNHVACVIRLPIDATGGIDDNVKIMSRDSISFAIYYRTRRLSMSGN